MDATISKTFILYIETILKPKIMKTKAILILMTAATFFITSCEKANLIKKHKQVKAYTVVSTDAVPQPVKNTYAARYSGATVETWYKKDNTTFAAKPTPNSQVAFASFTKDGNFIKEGSEVENEVENEMENENESENESGD